MFEDWDTIHLRRRGNNSDPDGYDLLSYCHEKKMCRFMTCINTNMPPVPEKDIDVWVSKGMSDGRPEYVGVLKSGSNVDIESIRRRVQDGVELGSDGLPKKRGWSISFGMPVPQSICGDTTHLPRSILADGGMWSAAPDFGSIPTGNGSEGYIYALEHIGTFGAVGVGVGTAVGVNMKIGAALGGLLGATCGVVAGMAAAWVLLKLKEGQDPAYLDHRDWRDIARERGREWEM